MTTIDKTDISTDTLDTPQRQNPTPGPSNTESPQQHEFLSPWAEEALLAYKSDYPIPEESLQSFTSDSPPATNQDEGTANMDTINIDPPNFNAPFEPISDHPLHSIFPEVISDFPLLSNHTSSGGPIFDWSEYDITGNYIADSAVLGDSEFGLTNIDPAENDESHWPLVELMSGSSQPGPLSNEPGSISNPSRCPQTEQMEETEVFPFTNDFGNFLKRITVEEFENALTKCLTSQPDPFSNESGNITNFTEFSRTEEMNEIEGLPITDDFGEFLRRITVEEFEDALLECLTSQPGREMSLPVRARS
ncbi:MAG: hypothetical protein Q9221_005908 [Calogaya cf. arnoldii]